MTSLKVPTHILNICKEIYSNSTQKIISTEGLTNEIKITQGIKQGCPLSSLLFNLVLEGVFPHMDGGYKFGNGTRVKILAYADNICIIGRSKEDMTKG